MRLGALVSLALLVTACAGDSDGTGASSSPDEPGSPAAEASVSPAAPVGPVGLDPDFAADAADLAALAQAAAQSIPQAGSIAPRDSPVLGGDISWPQCPTGMGIEHKQTLGLPMPTAEAEFVIIGLTNGPGFHANPCLSDQAAYARKRGLLTAAYAVASYPSDAELDAYGQQGPYDGTTPAGALKNVGYQQAKFNVASMRAARLASPLVWIDVEPVPYYEWSTSTGANAAVVVGAARAYADAGLSVGVYSTPYLWDGVVGDLELGVPEWRAAGQSSRAEAERRCAPDWSIQGGEAVLGQWVEDRRDKNVTCPGAERELGRWFAAN